MRTRSRRKVIENIILPNRTPVNKSRCIISSLLQYCFYFRGVSAGTSYEINFVATYIITVHAQVRVFTARRYASAAFAVIACPSVCLSVRYKSVLYRNDCRDEMSWFWHRSFFPPIPHCVIRKFGYLQNLVDRVLSTKLVVVDGRACWRHLYDNRRVVAVYYK